VYTPTATAVSQASPVTIPLTEISELTCPNWAGSRKRTDDGLSADERWRMIKEEEEPQPPRKKLRKGERIVQYTGEEGQERLSSIEFWDGSTTYYSGDKGREHKDWSRMPTKDLPAHKPYLIFYEGLKGVERIARTVSQNGNRCFFKGEQRAERLVRIENSNTDVVHYEGLKGAERKCKLESDTGTEFYKGPQNHERRVRTVYHNGRMQHYRGAKGKEKTWRVLHPDGQVDVYDTTTSAGTKSKIQFSIFPNGRMQHHTSGRTNPAHVLEGKQQVMKECIHNAQEALRELSEKGDVNEGAFLKMSTWFQSVHNSFLACKSTSTLTLVDEREVDAGRRPEQNSELSESAEDQEESEDQGEEGDAAYREEVARGFVGIPPAARRASWAVN